MTHSYKAIFAMADHNRVIGRDGKLPWHLPEDLAFFKKMTSGNTIVMGRHTMEEIRKPLPKRRNVVLTRQQLDAPGFNVIHNLDELDALEPFGEVYIIGGAQVYALALPHCSDIYVTHVKGRHSGDTFMPPFEDMFAPHVIIQNTNELRIVHYKRTATAS